MSNRLHLIAIRTCYRIWPYPTNLPKEVVGMVSCPLHRDCEKELDAAARKLGYPSLQDFINKNDKAPPGASSQQELARTALHSALDDASRRAYRKSQAQIGRDLQYDDAGMRVKVRNGYSVDTDQYTTDIIVVDRATGEKLHVVVDENGQFLHLD